MDWVLLAGASVASKRNRRCSVSHGYLKTPEVIGVNLEGNLPKGATATDLTLRITELLRAEKVVGKFVEFHGEGAKNLSLADRATISNMAPEYGATMGFFPIDEKSTEYLELTGRSPEKNCSSRSVSPRTRTLWNSQKRKHCLH